jgi:hypothetical protein
MPGFCLSVLALAMGVMVFVGKLVWLRMLVVIGMPRFLVVLAVTVLTVAVLTVLGMLVGRVLARCVGTRMSGTRGLIDRFSCGSFLRSVHT